jgi:3-oxoacyl-[acyl-carrier-protein] synthase III
LNVVVCGFSSQTLMELAPMSITSVPGIGIAAIATYVPPWILQNGWFDDRIPRKFIAQTGIEARAVSQEDEVKMALRAAAQLQQDTQCDWRKCAAVIFVSPSFIPLHIAKNFLSPRGVRQERLAIAARQFAHRLKIRDSRVYATNWFCSGYARAMSLASSLAPTLDMQRGEFILVVTSSRISRITDYGCRQTAALFGDMATATLVTRTDNPLHPPHLELLFADARKLNVDGVFFDFHLRDNVLTPAQGGGQTHAPQRLVFSLDGMGIADTAPRAMTSALSNALSATGIGADEVQYVVPHQAGTGIVRLAKMKMESLGIRGEVVNDIIGQVGNVSSCSIPYALKKTWGRLNGIIACPTAAVGTPGEREMSQGCLLLRTTRLHRELAAAA